MSRKIHRRIRYAVVGLGHIAQVAVLPAFAHARRNSELGALVSGDAEKLEELGRMYDVEVCGGYDELERVLNGCDAVYIATPNTEHAEYAIRAARTGVHVLCEKPLATTDAECDQIIRACREAGVRIMTAYRLHFEPLTLEVLDLIRQGPHRRASHLLVGVLDDCETRQHQNAPGNWRRHAVRPRRVLHQCGADGVSG
jgi:glucose-fructose oxidoreductase